MNSASPTTKIKQDLHTEKELSQKEILIDYVLRNRHIWMLGFAYFFVYIIRTAINDWGQLFLIEYKQFSWIAAGTCIFCFEVGGFFGSLGAGWISDKFFGGKRGPVNSIFAMFVILAVASLWFTPMGGLVLASSVMFIIGFFIFGPQMLIGVAAAELSHKKAAGTATGFIGWFAYVGAATAGYPIGKITEDYGWGMFFVVLTVCSIVAVMLLTPLWSARSSRKKLAAGGTAA